MATFCFNLVLVVSTLLIFYTATGYALTCYECVNPIGGSCGNFTFFNKTGVPTQTCTGENIACYKSAEISGGYDSKMKRGCGPADYCSNITSAINNCTTCKSNQCNSSYNIVPSYGIITFLVLSFSYLFIIT